VSCFSNKQFLKLPEHGFVEWMASGIMSGCKSNIHEFVAAVIYLVLIKNNFTLSNVGKRRRKPIQCEQRSHSRYKTNFCSVHL